jgi:hypothetical protein
MFGLPLMTHYPRPRHLTERYAVRGSLFAIRKATGEYRNG